MSWPRHRTPHEPGTTARGWWLPNYLPIVVTALMGLLPLHLQAQNPSHKFLNEDQVVEIQLSAEFTPSMQAELVEWLDHITQALLQVYGRWPRENWEIAVEATSAGSNEPIPWAHVVRADVDRVEFYTAQSTTADKLKSNWTGYHELSHLLIPYRGWGDMWFSEGLATYYQNLLQARSGILDEQAMWQKIYEGFMRGRAQTEFDGEELQRLSPKLRQQRSYMRVYWSGAWYFLAAEVKLRQQSGGKLTLDHALERLNRCCADQKMSVIDMVRKIDEENELILFYPLYLEAIASTRVPEFEALFTSLGISLTKNRQVILQQRGPGASLRRQISAAKLL